MRKTVRFTKEGIAKLPENKPVVYKIITKQGSINYIGMSPRGRVRERLSEHLPGGPDAIPGSKIVIEQMDKIPFARRKEAMMIRRFEPKYNKRELYT